jgi:O-antigen/teichoic acid export membrane protein
MPQITIFGIHYLFGSLFFQLDTLLLALWKGDHDVGIYQSVFKFVSFALIFSDIAVNAFMPTLSRFNDMKQERWEMLGELLNKTLFLIALPITLTMFVYAEQIIYLIYGNNSFTDAVPLLRIFSLIILIRYSVETYALMLTTSRRQTTRMTIVVTATVINFLLNVYFISNYGVYGAALVSLVTNILVGLGYIIATRNLFTKWLLTYKTMLPLCFTITVGVLLWKLPQMNFIVTVPLVIIGMCVFSYYVGFTKEERKTIFLFKSGVSNV